MCYSSSIQQPPEPGTDARWRSDLAVENARSRTLLDTRETTDGRTASALYSSLADDDTSCVSFRHKEHRWHRTRVLDAFERLSIGDERSRTYASCGSNAWLMQSVTDPTAFSLRSSTCHDRWCPACARTRAGVIRSNLEPLIKGKAIRFVTLTLKHNDDSLTERLDRLLSRFALLRKLTLWRTAVDGGASFLEVKINPETMRWHPHLHILCVGRYLPLEQLRAAWLACTGDSHVVDIRIVKDPAKVSGYVTKYLTKPADNDLYRIPAALDEAISAMKGRRLVGTFGTWGSTALLNYESTDEWRPILDWPEFLARIKRGNQFCIRAMASLQRYEFDANSPVPDRSQLELDWNP